MRLEFLSGLFEEAYNFFEQVFSDFSRPILLALIEVKNEDIILLVYTILWADAVLDCRAETNVGLWSLIE